MSDRGDGTLTDRREGRDSGWDPAITRADHADAAEILRLQKLAYASEAEIYANFGIPPLLQTEEDLAADIERQVVLKATLDGRIVGSVRAYERDGTCHIGRLIVAPESQGRGLGKRLMREIEGLFGSANRFELFTGHRSERNLYLYQKLGYSPFRSEKASEALTVVYLQKPGACPAVSPPPSCRPE
jgi:ribosomal protein S18 acetylase RimI-like enzyme